MLQENFGAACSLLSALFWALGASQYGSLAGRAPALAIGLSRALVITPLFVIASVFGSIITHAEPWAGFQTLNASALGWLALAVVTRVGVADVAFIWSTRAIGVTQAIAVSSTYPLSAAIFGTLFRHEHLSTLQVGGLLLTVSGVISVILAKPQSTPTSVPPNHKALGVFWALVTALMWSLGSLFLRNAGPGIDAAAANAVRACMALPIILAMSLVPAGGGTTRPKLLPSADMRNFWLAFVFEGFLASYFGLLGVINCPIGVSSALGSLAPVFALVMALQRREPLNKLQITATCCVAIGTSLLAFAGSP